MLPLVHQASAASATCGCAGSRTYRATPTGRRAGLDRDQSLVVAVVDFRQVGELGCREARLRRQETR